METGRFSRRALGLAVSSLTIVACSPNKPSATVDTTLVQTAITVAAESPAVGTGAVDAGGRLPESLPTDAVPLPADGLVRSQANVGGTAKTFDLTYKGSDLDSLVASVRDRLSAAGYQITGEYSAKVKNVPSAGFVAKAKGWIVTVGGTTQGGSAALSVSVVESA